MSAEFVTLAVVRELLETQERAFKQIMEFQMNAVKEEMKLLKKDVNELKSSLTFSQKDIDDVKQKCYKIEERLMGAEDSLAETNSCVDELYDQQDYLENHSRRNNVKIMGITENDDSKESWEQSENKAIEAIRSRLKIVQEMKVERAHRVGRPRPPFRHIGGAKVKSKPRPIIVKFQNWKDKETGKNCPTDEARRVEVLRRFFAKNTATQKRINSRADQEKKTRQKSIPCDGQDC